MSQSTSPARSAIIHVSRAPKGAISNSPPAAVQRETGQSETGQKETGQRRLVKARLVKRRLVKARLVNAQMFNRMVIGRLGRLARVSPPTEMLVSEARVSAADLVSRVSSRVSPGPAHSLLKSLAEKPRVSPPAEAALAGGRGAPASQPLKGRPSPCAWKQGPGRAPQPSSLASPPPPPPPPSSRRAARISRGPSSTTGGAQDVTDCDEEGRG